MGKSKQEKGGGARKYDRNRKWCQAYRAEYRRESNKRRKLQRHLKHYPHDNVARMRLEAL